MSVKCIQDWSKEDGERTHSRAALSAGATPSKTKQTTTLFHASPTSPPSIPPASAFFRNSENFPRTISRIFIISPCKVRERRILFSLYAVCRSSPVRTRRQSMLAQHHRLWEKERTTHDAYQEISLSAVVDRSKRVAILYMKG